MDTKKTIVIVDEKKRINCSWLLKFLEMGREEEQRISGTNRVNPQNSWCCLNQEAVRDLEERVKRLLETASRQEAELKDLKHQAMIDPLTGVLNRSGVVQRVERILREDADSEGALCFLDLDDFKKINDSYGHGFGDQVLIRLARQLQCLVDGQEVVGRFGGDEFLIFLRKTNGRKDIFRRTWAICEGLDMGFGQEALSASIGVAVYPEDGKEFGLLLRRADQALYRSKCEGKKQVKFYEPGLDEE